MEYVKEYILMEIFKKVGVREEFCDLKFIWEEEERWS